MLERDRVAEEPDVRPALLLTRRGRPSPRCASSARRPTPFSSSPIRPSSSSQLPRRFSAPASRRNARSKCSRGTVMSISALSPKPARCGTPTTAPRHSRRGTRAGSRRRARPVRTRSRRFGSSLRDFAWGKELDETVLPAEAGLDKTHISFTKGCYPGQEPIARLHHRGHANRSLRVLEIENAEPGADIVWNDKVVGRVTSAVQESARLRSHGGARRRRSAGRRRGGYTGLTHAPVAQGMQPCGG